MDTIGVDLIVIASFVHVTVEREHTTTDGIVAQAERQTRVTAFSHLTHQRVGDEVAVFGVVDEVEVLLASGKRHVVTQTDGNRRFIHTNGIEVVEVASGIFVLQADISAYIIAHVDCQTEIHLVNKHVIRITVGVVVSRTVNDVDVTTQFHPITQLFQGAEAFEVRHGFFFDLDLTFLDDASLRFELFQTLFQSLDVVLECINIHFISGVEGRNSKCYSKYES